jgi:nucleotide-binding universal stress UspA family protein
MIVVGVDGSDGSRKALRWAAAEARLRGARLLAVHAWHVPYAPGTELAAPVFDPTEHESAARALLDEELALARDGLEGLEVERHLFNGDPAGALIHLAADDSLIVVGSRGRGGFAGLLLGSVSHQVAHRARCPVVIIPAHAG